MKREIHLETHLLFSGYSYFKTAALRAAMTSLPSTQGEMTSSKMTSHQAHFFAVADGEDEVFRFQARFCLGEAAYYTALYTSVHTFNYLQAVAVTRNGIAKRFHTVDER